jgi:hypothetical protein
VTSTIDNQHYTLSGYFLKYATMASYLDPKISDEDLLEALRTHYPRTTQRTMLSNQLHPIDETVKLLRRVEAMEAGEGFQKPHQMPYNPNQITHRQGAHPTVNDRRNPTQNQVRQIQYYRGRNRPHWNDRRHRYNNDRGRDSESVGPTQLAPHTPTFQGRQPPEQASNPSTSRKGN